jgi:hypothetical protein
MIDSNERIGIFVDRMQCHLKNLLGLLLLNFCVGQQPADKGANAKTKATLDFIAGLPKQGMFSLECIVISIHQIK